MENKAKLIKTGEGNNGEYLYYKSVNDPEDKETSYGNVVIKFDEYYGYVLHKMCDYLTIGELKLITKELERLNK